MPGEQGGAEGATGIAGGGLNPDVVEDSLAQDAAVGDAVQGDAAGEAKIFEAGFAAGVAGDAKHDLFGHVLDGAGEVHVALGEGGFGVAGRAAEEAVEAAIGHGEADAVIEIGHVEPEGAVCL